MASRVYKSPGGGGYSQYTWRGGGSDGASYCEHAPEILHRQKYLASKFSTQKNTRLKYLNTNLSNKTDFKT